MKIHSYLAGIPPRAVVCGYHHPPRISRKRRRHYKRQWVRAALLHVWQEYLWCMPGLRVVVRPRSRELPSTGCRWASMLP